MTKPPIYQFELEGIKEPEDLWNRLFFAWLKNTAEQDAMNQNRLRAHTRAITQLEQVVAKLLPEQSDDLRTTMAALQNVHDAWQQQSARSLENVERIALIAKQIVANQKTE